MIVDLPRFVRVWIWAPFACVGTFAPLLLSQILQMASIVVLPVSKPLFRKINTRIAATTWGYWVWAIQKVVGTKIEVTGDELPWREDAIVVANHQEMSDIVIILCLAQRVGSTGHLKWLVKDVIKYVPGVGWGMLFLDCVFLKRDWTRDAETIKRVFARIADNRLPVWLVSFPEGTRATPSKLALGRTRDVERRLEPFEHVLRPRPKGFAASILALRDHVKAVYSLTIDYHGKVPSLVGLIRGDARLVSIHVRRTPIGEVPRGDEQLSAWLSEDFGRKDRLLAQSKMAKRTTVP